MTDPNIRKRDADGSSTFLCTFSNQIEKIENPRSRNGTYKGCATLTFKTPKAAKSAVDVLNHEGQFSAKIDKDQLPLFPIPYSESVSRTVYIDMIPPYNSRHFFLGLIKDYIIRSFIIHSRRF
jgi:hypothetical protein